jgi:hypothetical protein
MKKIFILIALFFVTSCFIFADEFIKTTEAEAYNVIKGVITKGGSYVDKLWFPEDYSDSSSIGQVSKLAPGWYYNVSIIMGQVSTTIYTVYRNGIVFSRHLIL